MPQPQPRTMSKAEIGRTMERFAEAYQGHSLAVITGVPRNAISEVARTLKVPSAVKLDKTAYLVVPAPQEGELSDRDVEKVAGGLGDKYEANCESTLALGTSSMVVLNIG